MSGVAGGLEKTSQDLEATAIQVAGIAVELNAVAKDLNDSELRATVAQSASRREHLRLRAIGLRAEAGRLALAALNACAAAEQVACAARPEGHADG